MAKVAFPFYHRLNFFTVYEYLEARFDVRVRTLAAVIFILWRLGWMATAMYVPSLAINAATGGQVDLNTMTIVVGVLVTLYTMLGGIQAVIWNDVVQFCIMFGGLGATVAIVWCERAGRLRRDLRWRGGRQAGLLAAARRSGGDRPGRAGGELLRAADEVVALLVALVVGRMAQYTSDQVMVQRLQTTRSLKEARQAFIVNAAGDALWMIGLSFVGLRAVRLLPAPRRCRRSLQTDKLVPYFMSLAFPAGAVGLVIAAIMAASLSSIDSAINSCTSVAVVDLYNRVWQGRGTGRREHPPKTSARRCGSRGSPRCCSARSGTMLACNVSRIGTLLEINAKVVNAFTGPLFGIFLLAMFSRGHERARVLAAGVAGAFAAYYVAYHSRIGFLWPSTFGLAATLAVGRCCCGRAPAPADAPGRA